jgi:hypothetical protein
MRYEEYKKQIDAELKRRGCGKSMINANATDGFKGFYDSAVKAGKNFDPEGDVKEILSCFS